MKRKVTWALTHTTLLLLTYFGFAGGIEGAVNVAVFVFWFFGVMAILCAVVPEGRAEARRVGPSVPQVFNNLMSIAYTAVFAYYGFFWTAGVVAVSGLTEVYLFEEEKK
jgi:hypothetical protein